MIRFGLLLLLNWMDLNDLFWWRSVFFGNNRNLFLFFYIWRGFNILFILIFILNFIVWWDQLKLGWWRRWMVWVCIWFGLLVDFAGFLSIFLVVNYVKTWFLWFRGLKLHLLSLFLSLRNCVLDKVKLLLCWGFRLSALLFYFTLEIFAAHFFWIFLVFKYLVCRILNSCSFQRLFFYFIMNFLLDICFDHTFFCFFDRNFIFIRCNFTSIWRIMLHIF